MASDGFDNQELLDWWNNTCDEDIDQMLYKIVEYGGSGPAVDLVSVGTFLQAVRGGEKYEVDCTVEEATELGIAFYLASKIARWQAAILDSRRPSDDTLKDIAIYAMMARRNRAVGGWPVGPKEKTE